jgi:hypothetical protein
MYLNKAELIEALSVDLESATKYSKSKILLGSKLGVKQKINLSYMPLDG